jgi:hypothetical protein
VEQFKVFRAIGLSFKAWFANFIPFTLLAIILYSPVVIRAWSMPSITNSLDSVDAWVKSFQITIWLLLGMSTLLSPLLVYRVIRYMNNQPSSIIDSIKFGVRGILPALIFAGVTALVEQVPFGGIIATVITCYWFVAAPAAVVERLNPIAAFSRSNQLTAGRRGGIFGLCLLLQLVIIGVVLAYLGPLLTGHVPEPDQLASTLNHFIIVMLVVASVYQLFIGIVQAVSYSLLRADKDGVSNEELAKVFE